MFKLVFVAPAFTHIKISTGRASLAALAHARQKRRQCDLTNVRSSSAKIQKHGKSNLRAAGPM
jgi:hypothetical protein